MRRLAALVHPAAAVTLVTLATLVTPVTAVTPVTVVAEVAVVAVVAVVSVVDAPARVPTEAARRRAELLQQNFEVAPLACPQWLTIPMTAPSCASLPAASS